MGAVCCCLHVEDFEDYVSPSGSVHRHCVCFRRFIHHLLYAYASLFQRGEIHVLPSSNSGVNSLGSQVILASPSDNSLASTFRPPPRPLPYDADPRCSRVQRDGLVSRREKISSHCHQECEALRRSSVSETLSKEEKWNGSDFGDSKACYLDSSLVQPLAHYVSAESYLLASSEDEDVCPTCLEEYTPENPKIVSKCSHHFHLVCIYEWMERSDSCPVCGKVMLFDETT